MDFIQEAVEEVKKHNAKKVAIQLPDGLKSKAKEIVSALEKETDVILLAGSCFGACDLRDHEAKELGCDLLLHFGHADFGLKTELPVVYIKVESNLDIESVVKKAAVEIKEKRIGLVTVMQQVPKLEKAKEILEKNGKEVLISKPSGKAKYPGQLLGCDSSAALLIKDKVDAFLYLGTGEFHAIPIALQTEKPVYIADPELNKVKSIGDLKDNFLRKRFAQIEKAKDANYFGILVTTKKGQNRFFLAEKLKKLIEEKGKNAIILVYDTINPNDLINFRLDAYVNTACPRISIDDQSSFDKPVLNPFELEIVLGERKWEDYALDHF